MHEGLSLTVGLILGAGVVGGAVARLFRLPSLTGYLAAGLLMGKHGLDQIPGSHLVEIEGPINDFAMALVLFVLGGSFRPELLKRQAGRLFSASLLESLMTTAIVAGATLPVLNDPPASLLLGVMAVAVAPATTLVVMRELRSKGPLTDRITILCGLSNVITIVMFEIALLVLLQARGAEAGNTALPIIWDLFGSLLFGLVAGHALILLQVRIGHGNLALPLATVIFLTIGVCQVLHVPHMLAFMVTGAVVANRSRLFEPITDSMEIFAKPAYVAFFVVSGLHLDFQVFQEVGLVVGVYVAARSLAKVLGTRMGGHMAGLPASATEQVGPGLLCQAGAAIALAGLAGEYDPDLGRRLLNVILGGVAVFELAGPILLRKVSIASGEVPMGQLLVHSHPDEVMPSWGVSMLRAMKGKRRPRGQALLDLTVADVMRPNPGKLSSNDPLPKVLRFADHSPYNHFPVVDAEGRLEGLIPLAELDEIVYDPKLAALVIASDLVELKPDEAALLVTDDLAAAAKFFKTFRGNTAAVIQDRKSLKFAGMLARSEVLLLARHLPENGELDKAGSAEA